MKIVPIILAALLIAGCQPSGEAPKISRAPSSLSASPTPAPASESNSQTDRQVKDVANHFEVSQDKVIDTAGRASELSGGKASKQDMIDALNAFSK